MRVVIETRRLEIQTYPSIEYELILRNGLGPLNLSRIRVLVGLSFFTNGPKAVIPPLVGLGLIGLHRRHLLLKLDGIEIIEFSSFAVFVHFTGFYAKFC